MSGWCIFLVVALLVATSSCGFLPPMNQTSALVVNQTEYVSACGLKVLTFTASSTAAFYFELVFSPRIVNSINNNFFQITMALYGPSSSDKELNAFDGCSTSFCNSTSAAGCVILEACGNQGKPWFVYVRTTNGQEGQFSFNLIVRPQPTTPVLTINPDYRGDAQINVLGNRIDTSVNPLSAFDLYTFTVPSSGIPPGTSLEILLYTNDLISIGRFITYLNYGGVAFPNGGCLRPGTTNRTFLTPCEVQQGGTWGITVQRTLNFQNYSLYAYLMPGAADPLGENVQTEQHSLRTVEAANYFTYNLPKYIADDNTTQAQVTFVVENIIGGTLKLEIFSNGVVPGLQCVEPAKICSSKEGCHIVVPYCQIQSGFYLVVVTAVVVNDPFYPVYFTVLGRTRQVPTISKTAGEKFSGFLKLSEYDHYVINNPGGDNWIDFELYVDADRNDLPASMYIGYLPFPNNDQENFNDFSIPVEGILPYRGTRRNEFPACNRRYNQSYWKRCSAERINTQGTLRLCFLQLDPCELERFPNGIFLTIFNNNQSISQHTWTQNPFSYTVYTKVWSPHDFENTLVHGVVRTDVVQNNLKKAYVLGFSNGNLRITLSANFHEVAPSGTNLPEIQYEYVYSQKNCGPWCNTCYRVQSGPIILSGTQTRTFDLPRCVEWSKGAHPLYYQDQAEYVYLVIKGIDNNPGINHTENRYVITVKDLPLQQVYDLYEGQMSNYISTEAAFGLTEYWILRFNQNALYSHILSIKFRAHPRSGRRLILRLRDPRGFNPFCADDNWRDITGPNCKKNFEVKTYNCLPSEMNKGYCIINFQICNLTSLRSYGFDGYYGGHEVFDLINRIFLVEVGFVSDGPSPQYGAGFLYNAVNRSFVNDGTVAEHGYSLRYDLVPQVAREVFLDSTVLVEIPEQQYVHFYINIDSGFATGNHHFIIEAYFDSNAILMDQTISPKLMTMYINDPNVPKLAGDPYHSFGCLCNKNKHQSVISGTKKFAYVIPPCDIIGGTYRFSFYTEAHAYHEAPTLINVRATMHEYVRPLPFEKLLDFSLYPKESVAFRIDVEPDMITSNTFVDKELRFRLSTNNIPRYSVIPSFTVTNISGDCLCGTFGNPQYKCTTVQDRLGSYDCRLNLGFCQLDPGVRPLPSVIPWYIIVNYPIPQAAADPHHVVPLSIFVTRFNVWRDIKPLTIASACLPYSVRQPGLISTFLESNQHQYFSVNFAGNGVFSAYIENITSGSLQVYFGNGYLPAPDPGCADNLGVCNEGSQGCKLTTTCPVTFIGVKALSNLRNRPVSYKITSCATTNAAYTLNAPAVTVNVQPAGFTDTSLSLTPLTNANFPMVVIFVSLPPPLPTPGNYVVTYTLGTCGTCSGSFIKSVNCSSLNCTLYFNVCELPLNYASLVSNVRIENYFTGIGARAFSLQANAVPIPSPATLSSNVKLNQTASQNNWLAVSWTLGSEVLAPDAGIQTSLLSYTVVSALGGGNIVTYVTFPNGDCPVLFNQNPYSISQCCTQPGTYTFAFFQLNIFAVTYEFFPQLITQSTHTYFTWANPATAVTQSVNMPLTPNTPVQQPTIFSELYGVIPLGIVRYSTLVVQPVASSNQVRVYINRNQQAGTTHGGCFASEAAPTLAGGPNSFNATVPLFLCDTIPAGIWIGFENPLNTAQTGSVTLSAAQPIRLSLGVSFDFTGGIVGVNQQFFFAPNENSWNQRLYRVNLTFGSGTTIASVFANFGAPAGPGANSTCLGNIASFATVTSPFSGPFPTCRAPYALPLPFYFIGVIPGSFTASYSIIVSEQDQLPLTSTPNNQLDIVGGPLTNQNNRHYFFTVTGAGNTSVLVVTVDGYTGNQNIDISILRDGKCVNYSESFCGVTTTFGFKCTNFVPACELKNGFTYHVLVNGVSGSFSIRAQLRNLPVIQLPYNYTTVSLTDNTQFFSNQVESHDFLQFKFTIPANFRDYQGGLLTINLERRFCGVVDVFATQGSMAGPGCDPRPRCSAEGCKIWEFAACSELFNGVIRHNLDIHILVRGKAPVEFKPIPFRFTIVRSNHHQMFPFRYLEKHIMWPLSIFEDQLPLCPAQPVVGLAPCCSGPGAARWYMPRTVYTFSVEGDEYLGYTNFHRLHLRLIDDRINQATLTVHNGYPTFCGSGPVVTENSGIVASCVADNINRNCTVNILTASCGLQDAHQFFFTVDPVTPFPFNGNAGALPTDPSTIWPVYSLSHTHQPYEIIEIQFSESPQYFRSTMAINEVSFYKVYHTAQNRADYHFVVTFLEVIGGTVSITNSWNPCNAASCSDSDCRNYDAERPCTEFLPDCSCKIEQLHCPAGEITKHVTESFFQLKATAVISTTIVHVHIRVNFIEKLIFQLDRICEVIGCADVKYYDTWTVLPNAEQLIRYRIKGVEGATTLSVQNDFVSLPGFPSNAHAPCRTYRVCNAKGPEQPGGYSQCEFFYREPGAVIPFATVNVANPGLGECTRALSDFQTLNKYRYILELDLINPPIRTLSDGNITDSTYFDGPPTCRSQNESYYYKFEATKGTYMVVELWSVQDQGRTTAEVLQLWVSKDHITYHLWGEALEIGCQTTTGLPGNVKYCRYLLICNFTTGTYYIQVSDTRSIDRPHVDHVYFHHKIRATTMTPVDSALPFLQGTRFVLPYDNRVITTFTIPVDGKTVNSEQDFEAFVRGNANLMDTWLTRSKFGGPPCAISVASATNLARLTVPNCWVTDTGDKFIVHVIRTVGEAIGGGGVCADSQVSVHSRFVLETDVTNATYQPNTLGGTPTTISFRRLAKDFGAIGHLVKYNLPPLKEKDVVYARVSSFDPLASLTVTIFKGNHIKNDQTSYGVFCPLGCPKGPQLPSTNVAWGDKCWHCGNEAHGPVFIRIDDAASQMQSVDVLTFNLAVVVTEWIDLTTDFQTVTFPNEEHTLSFFSMTHTRKEGTRVDIEVMTGAPIEVNVYADNCDVRTPQTQYWCFKGVRCEIPLPRKANFGSYYRKSSRDAMYLGNGEEPLRIVIRGFDSTYRIRQVRGTDSCQQLTPTNAPFCSSLIEVTQFAYWGEDNSDSYIAKDRNAEEFYNNLTKAFTCGVTDHCECPPQTEECRRSIKVYACQSMFNPCDEQGLEKGPTYRVCRNVEFFCGRTWICAGIPRLECNHTFYTIGIEKVDVNNFPLNPLDDPDYNNDSARRAGIIVLIVLLALLAILILAILAYIFWQRSSSLSSVVFDESKLGEYEAM